MTPRFPRPESRQHLVQSTLNAYLDWREHCAVVTRAYRYWAERAERAEAAVAWETYRAALDLEEKTSARYASLAEQVGGCRRAIFTEARVSADSRQPCERSPLRDESA
jgi:hypothetical protein